MIVGVDPKHTDLSKSDLNKFIARSFLKLQMGDPESIIEWEDGTLEIVFYCGNCDHVAFVEDGLIYTEKDKRSIVDRTSMASRQIMGCPTYNYRGRWRNLCFDNCECPCLVGQGYQTKIPIIQKEDPPYMCHCKDFDRDKLVA